MPGDMSNVDNSHQTSRDTSPSAANPTAVPSKVNSSEAIHQALFDVSSNTIGAASLTGGFMPFKDPAAAPVEDVASAEDGDSTPITDATWKVIGSAPKAARPDWLPKSGKGQANVDQLNWSITIEQWIMFIHACMQTETWKALVAAKGEYGISMHDINAHFIVPWSRGTGCSIALLLNSAKGCLMPVELMLSHAWGGSTVETFNCLQNLVNNHGVPPQTPVFFCALCLYQPEDGAPGGLSISQQLELSPFGVVIKSNPEWGMWVIHVTNFEVYSRTWTVHEVDEAKIAKITVQGVFDLYRWTKEKFDEAREIDTESSGCRPEDRKMLVAAIEKHGGFGKLDKKIREFRSEMRELLVRGLDQKTPAPELKGDEAAASLKISAEQKFDWRKFSVRTDLEGAVRAYGISGP